MSLSKQGDTAGVQKLLDASINPNVTDEVRRERKRMLRGVRNGRSGGMGAGLCERNGWRNGWRVLVGWGKGREGGWVRREREAG